MNHQIHRVATLVLIMFVALALSVSSVQGFARPALWESSSAQGTLTTDPRNARTVYAEYGRERGPIMVGSESIASSVPADDAYRFQRVYSDGELYVPVTGYFSTYFASMTGLERADNSVLSGEDPSLFSSRMKALITGAPQGGGGVELTLQPEIQRAAWEALAGREGAVVAIEPSTGAIVALVSSPSFDPNILASHDSTVAQTGWDTLTNDPHHPLSNRALAGDLYPPGSTFKILTTAAGLRTGVISPDSRVSAPDSLPLPGTTHEITNYAGESCGDGEVPLSYAFAHSCNTPFAQMAMDVGADELSAEASAWGWGDESQTIPLPVTTSSFPQPASAAETAMAGIGQASVRVTPMQMAMVAATIANRGEQMRPYVVSRIMDSDLAVVSTTRPQVLRTPIDEQIAQTLTEFMSDAVDDGTGTAARVPGLQIAGKTGTAETGAENGGPVTWFVGFGGVSLSSPTIALAVVLDGGDQSAPGDSGGSVAAPVAAAVFDAAVLR